jgi:AcrR family transcriptional regulator
MRVAETVKGPAPDRYPRRSAQARRTRVRVLDAARELFIERGYVATTIVAIADRADVSPETVYARFGSKRALLAQLVDLAIAGDVDAPPLLAQDWVREMRDEPDVHRRLRILAAHGRAILERRAAVDEVVRGAAAANPEIGALWELGRDQRYAGQAELLRIAVGATGLRDGLDVEAAADILYAIGSPDVYQLLVGDRGWTEPQFEEWYAETLERLLLPPTAPG